MVALERIVWQTKACLMTEVLREAEASVVCLFAGLSQRHAKVYLQSSHHRLCFRYPLAHSVVLVDGCANAEACSLMFSKRRLVVETYPFIKQVRYVYKEEEEKRKREGKKSCNQAIIYVHLHPQKPSHMQYVYTKLMYFFIRMLCRRCIIKNAINDGGIE